MKQAEIDSRVLLKPEVLARVRMSDSTLARLEAKGLFPRRIKLGLRKVGWKISAVEAWEQSLASSSTDRAA